MNSQNQIIFVLVKKVQGSSEFFSDEKSIEHFVNLVWPKHEVNIDV